MAMSDYNRGNPFVIKMENDKKAIQSDLIDFTKEIIITSFMVTLLMVASIAFCINALIKGEYVNIIILLFDIFYDYTIWFFYKYQTSKVSLKSISNMIHGDEYKDIYVNAEKVYELTNKLSELKGSLSITRYFIRMLSMFTMGLNAIFIIISIVLI